MAPKRQTCKSETPMPKAVEEEVQKQSVAWLRNEYPTVFFHAGMTGAPLRGAAIGWARQRAMGASKGYPDLFIYHATTESHGLAVEFKDKRKSLTHEQKDWLHYLASRLYTTAIVHTVDEFKSAVRKHMAQETAPMLMRSGIE